MGDWVTRGNWDKERKSALFASPFDCAQDDSEKVRK